MKTHTPCIIRLWVDVSCVLSTDVARVLLSYTVTVSDIQCIMIRNRCVRRWYEFEVVVGEEMGFDV